MRPIRQVSATHPGPGKAIGYCYRDADARLIVEAPALLALCKEMHAALLAEFGAPTYTAHGCNSHNFTTRLEMLIEKAEGRS